MREYVRRLQELGLTVLEAEVSELTGFWFIRAQDDQEGVEYAWAVDPCKGPVEDGEIPIEAWEAWW